MIELSKLTKSYRKEQSGEIRAVDDVTLQIDKGEFVAIVGPSGSGKSSLMNIIGLLDIPDSGSYRLNGKEIAKFSTDALADTRNKTFGFVFQQFHLLPQATAEENVELPLLYSDRKDIRGLAARALDQVGLSDRRHHTPAELSGGQQQRVAIARALVTDPEILLADEPTGNLDSAAGREIMDLFEKLNKQGKTIILITHDAAIANRAGRKLTIVDGQLREQ
jgi:ABC-type lipoprotein export system ATPase subunit